MEVNPLAGTAPAASNLVNVPKLITSYYVEQPDPAVPAQRVVFGTSGHRGSAFNRAFNEWHLSRPGDLCLPETPENQGAVVPREGHSRSPNQPRRALLKLSRLTVSK